MDGLAGSRAARYRSGIALRGLAEVFLVVLDRLPALLEPGLGLPVDVVVKVVTFPARVREAKQSGVLLLLVLVGRRAEGIHQLVKLFVGLVHVLILNVQTAGTVTAFTADVLQVGRRLLALLAGKSSLVLE